MSDLKVIVVGGGIVGMFAAYYLVRSGSDVSIIERNSRIEGASAYNSGLVSPSSTSTPTITRWQLVKALTGLSAPITFSPIQVMRNLKFFREALRGGLGRSDEIIIELATKSLELHREFLRTESPEVDIALGVLSVYNKLSNAENHQKAGGELIRPDALLKMGYRSGGAVFHKDEISMNPMKMCAYLRSKLSDMGATILTGTEANIVRDGNVPMIGVDGKKIHGDVYVLAAGSWTPQLCSSLGYKLPILPARGFAMLYNTGGAQIVQHPAIFEDLGITIAQNGQNLLRATSFFEMVGFDNRFNRRRREWLAKIVRTHLSGNLKLSAIGYGFR